MWSNETAAVFPTSFTLFNDFPADIRYMIWAEAINPGFLDGTPLDILLEMPESSGSLPQEPILGPSYPFLVLFRNPRHPRFTAPRDRFTVFGPSPRPKRTTQAISPEASKDTTELIFFQYVPSVARMLPFFPSLQRILHGRSAMEYTRSLEFLRDWIRDPSRGALPICGDTIDEDPNLDLQNQARLLGHDVVRLKTTNFHTNVLLPLVERIKAKWVNQQRVLFGQQGAAPELVQSGDAVVGRLTVVCRNCGRTSKDQEREKDTWDLSLEERRQLDGLAH